MAVRASPTHSTDSTNIADLLERVLDKGVVIAGDVKVSLLDIELLTIQLRLVICSVDKAKEMGMDWWANNPVFRGTPIGEPSEGRVVEPKALPEADQLMDVQRRTLDALERLEQRIGMLEGRQEPPAA